MEQVLISLKCLSAELVYPVRFILQRRLIQVSGQSAFLLSPACRHLRSAIRNSAAVRMAWGHCCSTILRSQRLVVVSFAVTGICSVSRGIFRLRITSSVMRQNTASLCLLVTVIRALDSATQELRLTSRPRMQDAWLRELQLSTM